MLRVHRRAQIERLARALEDPCQPAGHVDPVPVAQALARAGLQPDVWCDELTGTPELAAQLDQPLREACARALVAEGSARGPSVRRRVPLEDATVPWLE